MFLPFQSAKVKRLFHQTDRFVKMRHFFGRLLPGLIIITSSTLMVGYASIQQQNLSSDYELKRSSEAATDSVLVQQTGPQMLSVIPLNRINIP